MKNGLKDLLYQLRWIFIPYLVVLAGCLIIKIEFSKEEIFFAVNDHHSKFGDLIAPFFTDLGEGLTIVILSLIIIIFFNLRNGFLLLTSYAVTGVTAQVVKFIFDSPRPALYFKSGTHHLYFIKGIQVLSLHSFPSGHTVTAFSAAVALNFCFAEKRWGLLFLIVAMLTGFSRIYLGEHFFEDVVAGSMIGFYGTIVWLLWIDKKVTRLPKWNVGLIKLKKS